MIRTRGIVLALVALAACVSSSGSNPGDERPECQIRFAAPSGFDALETFEEDYPDHIGVRLGYRDDERREFHVLVGIPGEIGEGLPTAGDLDLRDGLTGVLVGRDEVWIVVWNEHDICDPRAVIGNGFTRETFVAALADAGLM